MIENVWKLDAACFTGDAQLHDLFFRRLGEDRDERETRLEKASLLCDECPVRIECFDYGDRYASEYGVWGGIEGAEIQRLRRLKEVLAAG